MSSRRMPSNSNADRHKQRPFAALRRPHPPVRQSALVLYVRAAAEEGISSPLKNRSCFETRLRRSSARTVFALSHNEFPLTLRRREAPSRRVAAFFNGLFTPHANKL